MFKKLIYVSLLAATLLAADEPKKAEPPKSAPLTELQAVKVENIRLQEQMLQSLKSKLVAEICQGAGFPENECFINPQTGTVNRQVAAAPPALPNTKE